MMGKTCTNCGTPIPEGAAFCTACGTKVPADPAPVKESTGNTPILCPHCGHTLAAGAVFCTECGQAVKKAEEPAAAKPAAPAQTPSAQAFSAQAPSAQGIPAAAAGLINGGAAAAAQPAAPVSAPVQPPERPAAPQAGMYAQNTAAQNSAAPNSIAQNGPAQQNGSGAYRQTAPGAGAAPVQSPYPQPRPAEPDPSPAVGTGTFFGLMLLFSLPLIGPLACLISAFAPRNKNIRSYARAHLIWILIGLIIVLCFAVILRVMWGRLSGYIGDIMSEAFPNTGTSGYASIPGTGDINEILGFLNQ